MDTTRKLTGTLRALALLLALSISVGIPAGYYLLEYQKQSAVVATEAHLNSILLSQAISESPEYWRFEERRLVEIITLQTSREYDELLRIITADNEVITQTEGVIAPPLFTVVHNLYDSGNVVGRIEIITSLRPLLMRTAITAIISLILGLAVYLTLKFFPLRVLSSTLQLVFEEKNRALSLLNNIGDIAWMKGREGRYIAANEPFARLCGVHPSDLPGKTDLEIWPKELAERYRADDREVMQSGRSKQIEEPIIDTAGELKWILTVKSPVFDNLGEVIGTTGIAHDFTERKRMEEELRESRQHLLDIIQFYPDATMVIDVAGKVVAWNQAMEELSGVPAAEMLGKGDYEYALPFYGERRPILIDLVILPLEEVEAKYTHVDRRGNTLFGEAYMHNAQGKAVYFQGTAAALRNSRNEIIGAIESIRNISERKLHEEALREKEEKLCTITTTVQDAIIMLDNDGRISFWNPAAELIFGYPADEALGMDLHALLAPQRYAAEYRKGLTHFRETGQGLAVGKILELTALRKGGEEFPIELSLSALQLKGAWHAVGIIRDIATRKRAEEAMQQRGALVERLNKSLVDLAGNEKIYGGDLTVAFRAITEASALALVTERVSIWFYTEGNSGIKCMDLYEISSGKHSAGARLAAADYPAYFRTLQAEYIIAADNAVTDPRTREFAESYLQPLGITAMLDIPIRVADRVSGVACHEHIGPPRTWSVEEQNYITAIAGFTAMAIEIFERKKAETRIKKINEELEQRVAERTRQLLDAQEELVRKEKLAILGQLSGSVGHELRNPLGVMSNAVYFLKMVNADADETTREYLDIIKQEIDNSMQIITDLLDFARTKTPQSKTVKVAQLVEESIGKCVVPENVGLYTDLPDTLPALVIDPLQMVQVLQNLITNAVQAMPDGGSLRIAACINEGDYIGLTIADTGGGISPENMNKLFQPLFTTKAKGIGLGLVVCKNLVEANGGKITVESEPGSGTLITLLLPAGG